MADNSGHAAPSVRHRHHQHMHQKDWHGGPVMYSVWFIGWLFSVGYLHMPFFRKGVLALVIWPYHLGKTTVH